MRPDAVVIQAMVGNSWFSTPRIPIIAVAADTQKTVLSYHDFVIMVTTPSVGVAALKCSDEVLTCVIFIGL
jgi:hypothetical protein